MSLTHETFLFGGHKVSRRVDGYFNCTEMCKTGGKMIAQYRLNASTKDYMECLSKELNIPQEKLLEPGVGGASSYIHPLAAVHLAQWISPAFAVFVSKLVYRYTSGDVTLAAEVVQNHDKIQDTVSTMVIDTKKRKALDGDELEKLMVVYERVNSFEKTQMDDRTKLMFHDAIRNCLNPSTSSNNERTELPVSDVVRELGFRATPEQLKKIGVCVSKAYEQRHGLKAPLREQYVDGTTRQVRCYKEADYDLIRSSVQGLNLPVVNKRLKK